MKAMILQTNKIVVKEIRYKKFRVQNKVQVLFKFKTLI